MTLDEQAIYYHEWYLSLVRAGFTIEHAIILTAASIQGQAMANAVSRGQH